jgi:transmembrane sensor
MLNERFIELLTKKLSADIDAGEAEEFDNYLGSDETYRQQYIFFKDYWVPDQEQYSNTDMMFQRIKAKIGIIENDRVKEKKNNSISIFRFLKSIAAILIACIGLTVIYYFSINKSKKTTASHLGLTKTASRVKSKITLSDGSVVTLNSETTLKYPQVFAGHNREVYLSGEAFFDVTKDPEHPFIVHAGKMNIKVLGTAFNIKSYINDPSSETTLIRGAIEVTMSDRPSDRIILKPSEKLILSNIAAIKQHRNKRSMLHSPANNSSYALTSLTYLRSNDSTVVETSWVNNKLVFKDEDFVSLANKMERWYGVKIKFKNSISKDFRFTGLFEKENVIQAMTALQMIEHFTFDYKNETVYIY